MTAFLLQPPALTLRKPLSFERATVNWEHPVNRGMVAWWLLNEWTGNVAYDVTGNGNNAVWTGTRNNLLYNPDGIYTSGGCYGTLTGTMSNSDITVACKCTSSTSHGSVFGGTGATPYKTFLFDVNETGSLYVYIGDGSSYNSVYVSSAGITTTPTFAAVTRSASATPLIYINGIKQSTTGTATRTSTFTMELLPQGYQAFDQKLYYLQIWNRALSDAEILYIYSNPWGTPDNPRLLIYPRRTWFVPVVSGATIIPHVMADYRRRRIA